MNEGTENQRGEVLKVTQLPPEVKSGGVRP